MYIIGETSSDFPIFLILLIWAIGLINITKAKKLASKPTVSIDMLINIYPKTLNIIPKNYIILYDIISAIQPVSLGPRHRNRDPINPKMNITARASKVVFMALAMVSSTVLATWL